MSLPPPLCYTCKAEYPTLICEECGEYFCEECIKRGRCPECGSLNLREHNPYDDVKPVFGFWKKRINNPYKK